VLPTTNKDALEEHFSLSNSQLENIVRVVSITAPHEGENREKAKSIIGMQNSAFLLDLW
jgi:hypothetical protein